MSKALFVGFKFFIDLGIYCELQLWVTWAFWVPLAVVKLIYGRKSENAVPHSFVSLFWWFFFSPSLRFFSCLVNQGIFSYGGALLWFP